MAVVAQGRVVACSAEARALGVRRRMRLREAQQRCPGLRVVERDLAAETRDFEPLAARIEQRVVPRLEVLRPGLLAFPARGAARYWGGEEALAEKVLEVVAETGVEGRTGVADTLFAAALAARSGRPTRSVPVDGAAGFLAPYPVGVLGHRELTQLLTRLGLTTLGDFAALPADRVLARFGPPGAAAHRTARGLEARVPHTRVAGTDRSASVEFEPAERAVEPVVFRAKALAEELHGTLRRAGLACSRVEVAVRLTDGRRQARMWRHEGLSALAVAERVRWQLAAWQQTDGVPSPGGEGEDEPLGEPTPAGGSGVEPTGITGLTLTPDGLHAEEGRQGELFDSGAATREEVERAAGRLQAMLGHGAVTRVELGGGRGPGEQVLRIPFGEPDETAAGSGTAGGRTEARWVGRLPAPHPAVVYREPLPARLWDAAGVLVEVSGRAVLSAPPARLEVVGRGALEVTGWAGPWPVLEQWWDPSRDRRLARLQIATADGRAWLVQVAAGRWRVEACYG
ncbi:DNA polymerase Y family protein [Streptomyces sp. XM4193]|uniref:DNA polymerase Y family protein n=1 Tax=Streptomyces sp. XM4193 TaxID=2929782 RepID=UPI001FF98171|nr:DNA polymerase Y family protein [Streptomyces sp. XM4193]MCK1795954.1 DNA polymerase Y family protein [Streptomyces sp. XM4193]